MKFRTFTKFWEAKEHLEGQQKPAFEAWPQELQLEAVAGHLEAWIHFYAEKRSEVFCIRQVVIPNSKELPNEVSKNRISIIAVRTEWKKGRSSYLNLHMSHCTFRVEALSFEKQFASLSRKKVEISYGNVSQTWKKLPPHVPKRLVRDGKCKSFLFYKLSNSKNNNHEDFVAIPLWINFIQKKT